jgi:hypothetical protein
MVAAARAWWAAGAAAVAVPGAGAGKAYNCTQWPAGLDDAALTAVVCPGAALSGELPAALATLPLLQDLDLSNNQLSGGVPGNWSAAGSLTALQLNDNQLSGALPALLPASLLSLVLDNNRLTGGVPPEWGNLTSLVDMSASGNLLSGSLPDSLRRLSFLQYLDLSYNTLSGDVRDLAFLGDLTGGIGSINLSGNRLTGCAPSEIQELCSDFSGFNGTGETTCWLADQACPDNANAFPTCDSGLLCTFAPSSAPTLQPSSQPTLAPSQPSPAPTGQPTAQPTVLPTAEPTTSDKLSGAPGARHGAAAAALAAALLAACVI